MGADVVITGIGLVTALGNTPAEVLRAMAEGRTAGAECAAWAGRGLGCSLYAPMRGMGTEPLEQLVPESKLIRLMNRDAMLAVAAARRAVRDAGLEIGRDYAAEEVGLFGATGLAGVAVEEVARMVRSAADAEGRLDLGRFGAVALRQVRPVLSFKILSNMPLCFVSIFEGIQGINAVYNPWEGQGAQAIVSAIRAIEHGDAACALAGGCDVKTHSLGLIALEQQGVFESWHREGKGTIPGEGACFVVLEQGERAMRRGARIYARVVGQALQTVTEAGLRRATYERVLREVGAADCAAIAAAGDGDQAMAAAEGEALATVKLAGTRRVYPKRHVGNLFAAAATLQVGLAAQVAHELGNGGRVLADCFGYGSQQGAFLLEGIR